MILIADSGSTKTSWKIIKKNIILDKVTIGLNPYFINKKIFIDELNKLSINKDDVNEIYFYGSGCQGKEQIIFIKKILRSYFINLKIVEVNSDLLAAARACYGYDEGVVSILGTGSNTAYYNGNILQYKFPSLGYILGDQGSGAYLGKLFLSNYFQNKIPNCLTNNINLDINIVLDNIYKSKFPNTYLASFTKIILKHKDEISIKKIINKNFIDFITSQINPIGSNQNISLIGSIAYFFKEELELALNNQGHKLKMIIKNPINNLISFHLEK